ncbi:hypothetical protein HID58_092176 [Brassica napus]|uniref:Uncharacterized protein n=1 Tax=Brassica napus TaxID=3708 RepID=A0ABQ7WYT9_BRANA|nr:hypothetical protein HID58_092176 [Brassica napus]
MHNNRENTNAHSPRRRRCLWPPALTLQPPLSFSSNSLCNFVLCFIVCYVAISALCSTHSGVHPLRALLAEKRSSISSALLITTYNRRDPPTSSSCFVNLRTFDYASQIEKVKSRSTRRPLAWPLLIVTPLRLIPSSMVEGPNRQLSSHRIYHVRSLTVSLHQPQQAALSMEKQMCFKSWGLLPLSPLSPTFKLRETYVHLNSKVVPSTTLCVVLLRQPIHSSLQRHLNLASPDFVNCNLSETVSSTTVCSPTPEASPHLTATSGDPYVFRDGYQQHSKPIGWVLQRRFRLLRCSLGCRL